MARCNMIEALKRTFGPGPSAPPLEIGTVAAEEIDGASVIRSTIDGHEVWFRSRDAILSPTPSVMACLFLLPALRDGRQLVVDEWQLDPALLKGFHSIAAIARRWWNWEAHLGITQRGDRKFSPGTERRTGLFFSGGVDSFHSLLQRMDDIDDLVVVHGFDVLIEDYARYAALHKHAAEVARKFGKGIISVETNLRSHPLLASMKWGQEYHGAALAAAGHALSNEMGRMFISSSYPWEYASPWGSSAAMDPLWSSSTVTFEHICDDLWRSDKLALIADNPVVHKHLVVCWEGQWKGQDTATMNCCRCEKCLRTMVTLAGCGSLDKVETFPDKKDIVQKLDALPPLTRETLIYTRLLQTSLPPDIAAAVERLLGRSPAHITPNTDWTHEILASRIASTDGRTRHPGGSPNAEEIAAYGAAIDGLPANSSIVVLGMTPELRRLAVGKSRFVVAVDRNPKAVALYKDWLSTDERSRETVIQGDWRNLPSLLPPDVPVSAVLGDGIFGNMPGLSAHRTLLRDLAEIVPTARIVLRKALAAEPGDGFERGVSGLIDDFRSGRIDEAEFGFCTRLAGFLDRHYQVTDFRLRNRDIFRDCAEMHKAGILTDREFECILRYRFDGDNCILTREAWEKLLGETGWNFTRIELEGKRWYPIYPLYVLEKQPPVQ